MALLAGDKLGPYEIHAPIGAGGMGEVYKACDTRLGRTVAVKVLPSHIAAREDLKQRFEREAHEYTRTTSRSMASAFRRGNRRAWDDHIGGGFGLSDNGMLSISAPAGRAAAPYVTEIDRCGRQHGTRMPVTRLERYLMAYEPGKRSGAWTKLKIHQDQELVTGGYNPRRRGFDALLAGYYKEGRLLFPGIFGTVSKPQVAKKRYGPSSRVWS